MILSDLSRPNTIELETRNGLSQFDAVSCLIDEMQGSLVLTPSIIKDLHRRAMVGIHDQAGSFRDCGVTIRGAKHKPPSHLHVPGLVADMCLAANSADWEPLQVSAYLLWRLNWIHPFADGNGRTSRAVSYLALCVRLQMKLPGRPSIPEQLTKDRPAYYQALADADHAWNQSSLVDVSELQTLLEVYLERQLELPRSGETGDGS